VRFYTTLKLGPNREKTPEGFLLCRNVPIARTGTQLYGPGETPISDSTAVQVERTPEQVFRPETIASFNGKPFTLDHPDSDVTPDNWNLLTKGIILEPRRGVGIEDDLLLADLLVYDPEAIRLIEEEGMNEVSAGYDAGYEQDEDSKVGYQVDILGNHVALVQAGRCGPRCAIRDCAEEIPMTKLAKWKDAVRAAFKANDAKALDCAMDQLDKTADEESATHIHIHGGPGAVTATDDDPEVVDPPAPEEDPLVARLGAIERELANLGGRLSALESGDNETEPEPEEVAAGDADPDDDEETEEEKKKRLKKENGETEDVADETSDSARDEATKVGDSRYMEESVQMTMAAAEILTPGITFPTFDRANKPAETAAALTGLRKKSLSIFASTAEGGTILTELRGGKVLGAEALKKLSVKDARTLFYAAAAQVKQRNRDRGGRIELAQPHLVSTHVVGSLSEMNRVNREFWAKKRPN
jgi:hypothetical protein